MLDQMSGGRFQIGIGRGVSRFETAAYGLDFDQTGAMYHEVFQILLKGLTSEELTYEGQFHRFERQPMVLRPIQQPHPPLWYGITMPQNADWPAANDVNVIALGLRDTTAAAIAGYRDARKKHGRPLDGTLYGVSRHVVVADTDEAALQIAREAYPAWRQSFRWLFNRNGAEPRVIAIYPESFDELMALKNGIAGSPETVRRFIAEELEVSGGNYFVPHMAFGTMALADTLRSIELFSKEVMPAF